MKDLYDNNTGRNGFFKASPFLIVVLLVIFIPLSVVTSICYFQTKKNSNTPTFFSNVVVKSDAKFEQYDINVGDKVLVKKQNQELSKVGVLVAYFDATEEEPEDGSPVRLGYLQYFGKDTSGETVYGFVGNEKLIISDAIIGVYETNSSALIGIVGFLSSNLALILLSIAPLGFTFVLLVLDILEQKRIKQTNKEIFVVLNPEDKKQNTDLENLSKDDQEKQIDVAKDEKQKTENVQIKKSLDQHKVDDQTQVKKLEEQSKNNPNLKQQPQKMDSLTKESQQNKKVDTQQQQSKPASLENSSKPSTVGIKEEAKQQPAKPQRPQARPQAENIQKLAMPQKPTFNDKAKMQGNDVVEKQNVQKFEDIASNVKETKGVGEKPANNVGVRPERPDKENQDAQNQKTTDGKTAENQKQSTASVDALPPKAPQKQAKPPQKPVSVPPPKATAPKK